MADAPINGEIALLPVEELANSTVGEVQAFERPTHSTVGEINIHLTNRLSRLSVKCKHLTMGDRFTRLSAKCKQFSDPAQSTVGQVQAFQ